MANFIPTANGASLGDIWKQKIKMTDFDTKCVKKADKKYFDARSLLFTKVQKLEMYIFGRNG